VKRYENGEKANGHVYWNGEWLREGSERLPAHLRGNIRDSQAAAVRPALPWEDPLYRPPASMSEPAKPNKSRWQQLKDLPRNLKKGRRDVRSAKEELRIRTATEARARNEVTAENVARLPGQKLTQAQMTAEIRRRAEQYYREETRTPSPVQDPNFPPQGGPKPPPGTGGGNAGTGYNYGMVPQDAAFA
jgi:hypothetical protein